MTLTTTIAVTSPCDPHEIFHKCRELLGATDIHPFKDERVAYGESEWEPAGRKIGNKPGMGLPALMWVTYQVGPRSRQNWTAIHFDTPYAYLDKYGGCSTLHARLVFALGQWLDAHDLVWRWQNEITGDWHAENRYRALGELIDTGRHAEAWFAETVEPTLSARS